MVVLIGFLVGALAGGALVRLGGSASPSAEPSAAPPVTAPSSPTLPGGQTDPFSGLDPTDPFGGGQGGNQNGAAPSSPQSPSTSGGGLSTEDMNAVADKVTPGVVHINTVTAEGQGAGTGMVLEASGVVLTNNHVVRGATQIVATDADTGRRYAAKVLGTDATDDVALLQLQSASGLGTVDTGDSGSLDPGEPVVAVGNAGGRGGDPTVVTGSVIATDQAIDVADESGRGTTHLSGLIQIDAPIEPGDSGGPLADADGKVVGINTAASADMRTGTTTGEGYAVPIEKALAVVEQIQSGKGSDTVHIGVRGVLGVSVSTGNSGGASVLDVAQGSGAEDAGITAGSVVTAVDGTQVDSADTLTSAMANRKPGDKVTIVWVDQSGSRHSAQVTLTEGPPD